MVCEGGGLDSGEEEGKEEYCEILQRCRKWGHEMRWDRRGTETKVRKEDMSS
jgi:hypothetical protein